MPPETFDKIIVGGGSAGSVLARRLSSDPNLRVLVLEAGPPDHRWDFRLHMPAALTYPLAGRTYNWWYESGPEPALKNRRVYQPRGRVLGGSSAINGMIYIRGNPLDFEGWAQIPGLESWGYANVLPYFKRIENRLSGADDYHGGDGALPLTTPDCESPLFEAFFSAVQQAGYPLTDDVNGYQQEGFGKFDRTTARGRRVNAARAYLHPVTSRPNLTLRCRTMVQRIVFEGRRAVGVEVATAGGRQLIRGDEIICCGGAINSPQLLQLSGVGPADLLESLGIPVVQDLPGVGEAMEDHAEVYVQYACKQAVSLYPALKWWRQPWIGMQWLFGRRGIGASNHFEAGGFIRSNDQVAYPNLQYHFLPIAIRYDGSAPESGHGYQVHVGPVRSDVRGHVRIVSADPATHPEIVFNYLSTEQDRREWVEAIRCTREIMTQPAFDDFRAEELAPGPGVQSDEEILQFITEQLESAYHPSCTCKMGYDPQAVTGADLKVHGLEGLRVVDASVMPAITNGNIYAPVLMIAEKAADIILGNDALKPLPLPFYVKEGARDVSGIEAVVESPGSVPDWTQRIEAVLFDMDGTLLDSEHLTDLAIESVLNAHDVQLDIDTAAFHGVTWRRTAEILRDLDDRLTAVDLEAEFQASFHGGLLEAVPPVVPGATEAVSLVAARLPTALVSSSDRVSVNHVVNCLALEFQEIICAEDCQRSKPDPQGYLTAAERLGVAPERCLVFEDSVAGLRAAKAAGMRVIAIGAGQANRPAVDLAVVDFKQLPPNFFDGLGRG